MKGFSGFGNSPAKQVKEGKSKSKIEKNVSAGPGSYWDKKVKGDRTTTTTKISGHPKDSDVTAKSNVTMGDIDEHTTSKVKVDKKGKKFVVQQPQGDTMYGVDLQNMPDNSKQTETVTNVTTMPKGYKSSRTGYKVNNTYFTNDSGDNINKSLQSVSDTLVLPAHLQNKYKSGDMLSQDDIYAPTPKKKKKK